MTVRSLLGVYWNPQHSSPTKNDSYQNVKKKKINPSIISFATFLVKRKI